MGNLKLFDAEYKFMCIVWEYEPVNSTELTKLCLKKLGWKKSTTYTMISKLSKRNILSNKNAIVTAFVKREQVQEYESEMLLERAFDNSLPLFLTAFLKGRQLNREEAAELYKMIEKAIK